MMEDNRIDFNKVGIDDSFMFDYIMQNAVRCKAFLEQILSGADRPESVKSG